MATCTEHRSVTSLGASACGHGFDNTPPAEGNILEEVLEEAVYLKEPTVLLLASSASCLLDDCLRKVGNDYTRTLLRLSLGEVAKAYPRLDSRLKRGWKTPDAAIGELRECMDALFDVLSTLDNVREEMKEEEDEEEKVGKEEGEVEDVTTAAIPEELESEYSLSMVGGYSSAEDQDGLERAFWEEQAAPPTNGMGTHWEIYQQYIRDRFPQAVGELDAEGLAKGNVDCYDRLVRLDEDRLKEEENVAQSAYLQPVLEDSAMHIQTAQKTLERLKALPSAGVATTLKDSVEKMERMSQNQ
ncbi:uncharacterized protein H6S33_007042 [Morchella sextelata]|uniref:uncharacterized protein n=1 Tax=Morchella sextelata TaxID=1174677 RepID=UPI001D0522F5|nr:uncharacterized protein H6S33_007042 [Morchella sextelata]KAH0604011.1 hypothetical protein H6S33_007042 [Morchella sextelata]